MNDIYCIKENNGVALCVCKHKPCKNLERIRLIAETSLFSCSALYYESGLRAILKILKEVQK